MKRIGILGGTFDPFHLGHMSIGECSISEVNLDKLILLPANVSPFKINKEMALEHHRVRMLEAFVENNNEFTLSRLEIDTDKVSYTFDTMEQFRKLYPADKLYFICGSDTFVTLENWYKGKDLLKTTRFIVASRPGISKDELISKSDYYKQQYGTLVHILKNDVLEISSTEIKSRIKKGLSIHNFVPEEIERYIIEHGLYK